ncbi:MAG: thiamine pyrophosphate-binding protein [SAR202 cluster bacterium]|nr:hypothetical protein [Dehalococcoidales bacterium]MDP7579213.1 thiamine pyrophosphate-binding protein [SAR202 cluster bacterium]|tara:strand:- start:3767 stop:5473 length:1707 start_codon:yes stop_codon:yes gene_type:complete
MHTGDLLAELLAAHGVSCVFGMISGQGYPLNDALHRREKKIRHVMVRDERSSAYAADGYARVSGTIGVCDAAFGVGAVKLLSGVAEAYNSSIPILSILSNGPRDWSLWLDHGCTAQGIEQTAMFEGLTKNVIRVPSQRMLAKAVGHGIQTAVTGRPGPVAIDIPADIFYEDYEGDDVVQPNMVSGAGKFPASRIPPDPGDIQKACKLLAHSQRPVLVAGGGVAISRAHDELMAIAEKVAMPVATTIAGKGVFPENHRLSVGIMGGQYGSESANRVVDESDLVFFVGAKSSEKVTSAWTRPDDSKTIIHLDIDPIEIGKIFSTECGILADAQKGLNALGSTLTNTRKDAEKWLQRVALIKEDWEREIEPEMRATDSPIRPQFLMGLLQKKLNKQDIVVVDASFSIGWVGTFLKSLTGGQRFLFPRGFASMGFGLPAAIGARFAQQREKVVVIAGDGSMTYAIGELSTLAKYGLDIIVIVLNNSCLGYTKIIETLDWHSNFESSNFPPTDFATISKGFGCTGLAVDNANDLSDVLDQAFQENGPVLIDVKVDETQVPELALRKRLSELKS